MNVSLTAELERWIEEKVSGGLYQSASEVVRDSLRLLRERDVQRQRMLEELRADVLVGVEQLDRGQARPLTRDVVRQVKANGRKRNQPAGATAG
jgi:antitoxin ParD1/3/4